MAQIEFRPAQRRNLGLVFGFMGYTGSGKSLSGLKFSRGLAARPGEDLKDPATLAKVDARIRALDTENGRLLMYAPAPGQKLGPAIFGFQHGEMRAPFSPQAYLDAINFTAIDCAVYMIDSFSHEWTGEGGQHDMQTAALEKMMQKNPNLSEESVSSLAWKKPKMDHRRLVSRLTQLGCHVVICLRAEEKLLVEKDPATKKVKFTAPADLPIEKRYTPECDRKFPYELTLSLLLTPEKPGFPIPLKLQEQHKEFIPRDRPISEESGRAIADWARGGVAVVEQRPPADPMPAGWNSWTLEERGINRASKGTQALRDWYKHLTPAERESIQSKLPELIESANKVEP